MANTMARATSGGQECTPTSAPIDPAATSCRTDSLKPSTEARSQPKVSLEKSEGYAATPLTGVWANYPYLHNGSVPTLYHLLGPVSERPRIFSVMAARHFDRERVGQVLYPGSGRRRLGETCSCCAGSATIETGSTRARDGCGNGGHDMWDRIKTDENRRALIEYLKTL